MLMIHVLGCSHWFLWMEHHLVFFLVILKNAEFGSNSQTVVEWIREASKSKLVGPSCTLHEFGSICSHKI